MALITTKTLVGWEEWFKLPDLDLPAIKAKIDSGAKTSSIHANRIKVFEEDGKRMVSFWIYPIQKTTQYRIKCTAPLVDQRLVSDSGGHREKRYVIKTTLGFNDGKEKEIEITLADRKTMAFRMLLGREAMKKCSMIVDPSSSCCLGKMKNKDAKLLYSDK